MNYGYGGWDCNGVDDLLYWAELEREKEYLEEPKERKEKKKKKE